jgi:hypothetical protein
MLPESFVRRYLVHILPMNDKPVLVSPEVTYARPKYCKATPQQEDCVDPSGLALADSQCHLCHFGPFFTYEGRNDLVVTASGLTLYDVDVVEQCGWDNQKCTALDISAISLNGEFDFNSRLGLNVYRDQASSKAFTGAIDKAIGATTSLNYRAPGSSFNTQSLDAAGIPKFEKIIITASDQGFSGAWGTGRIPGSKGEAPLAFGTSLSVVTEIRITIVAMNTPPNILFTIPAPMTDR